MQRQQIDVGITVDVLIHFHCIFGTDRKKSRINFCTTGELLRVILFSIQSPEDFVPIREIITITFFQACLLSCQACTLWVRNFQHLITFLWWLFWWWSYMGFYPLLLGKTWLSEMNLSIKQLKLSSFVLSQTAIHALIGKFDQLFFSPIFSCSEFLSTSSAACEQFGLTYREACKRIEMATSHVTPLSSACLLRDHQG